MFHFHIEDTKKVDIATVLVGGFLLAVVLSGVTALPFINWRLPFHLYRNLALVFMLSGAAFLLVIYIKQLKNSIKPGLSPWLPGVAAVFLLLICSLWIYRPDTVNDVTLETIRTTLGTDTIYEYNPVTGRALELGMYPVGKLYTLPVFYSIWAGILPVEPEVFLYYMVPIIILFLHFLVVYKWGRLLLKPQQTGPFMVFYGIVLLFGDYFASTLSYGLLHRGWTGQNVLLAVCIPYIGYLCVQMQREGMKPRFVSAMLLSMMAGLFLFPIKGSLPFGEIVRLAAQESLYGKYMGLWLICLLMLVLFLKREEKRFLIFFPLIPVPLVIAYGAVMLCLRMDKGRKQWAAAIALVVLVALSGSVLPYKSSLVKKKYENQDAILALEAVERLGTDMPDKAVLLAPDEIMKQARAYSAGLYPLYGKDLWNKNANRAVADDYTPEIYQLYELMKEDYLNQDEIAGLAMEYGCNVLVLRERITKEAGEAYTAWKIAQEVPGYLVYRRQDMLE